MKTLVKWLLVAGLGLASQAASAQMTYADYVFEVTKIMVHDVVSPPVAARYYAYSNLSAYLAATPVPAAWVDSLDGLRAALPPFPGAVDPELAATYALLQTTGDLLPSGPLLDSVREALVVRHQRAKLPERRVKASIAHARAVNEVVLAYAGNDGYTRLSALTGYTPRSEEGAWYPTPPAYMAAVEPHWNTLRTFFLDSAAQFSPAPPVPFDTAAGSDFYQQQLLGVYRAVRDRSEAQEHVAKFWDCNPFEVRVSGHTMIGLKKITPGGHWMGITGIACETAGLSFAETVATHALVALSLHDAFVSCWDEKYRSERIRPETVINRYIDPTWRPVLQTPPFPEYTSGHSVVSGAAATILTHLFGDNFRYVDDSEVYFGLPARPYDSFEAAAEEAAISRYYGGIHFPDACEVGLEQGQRVGKFVVNKIER